MKNKVLFILSFLVILILVILRLQNPSHLYVLNPFDFPIRVEFVAEGKSIDVSANSPQKVLLNDTQQKIQVYHGESEELLEETTRSLETSFVTKILQQPTFIYNILAYKSFLIRAWETSSIVTGQDFLFFPTAIEMGPDGKAYGGGVVVEPLSLPMQQVTHRMTKEEGPLVTRYYLEKLLRIYPDEDILRSYWFLMKKQNQETDARQFLWDLGKNNFSHVALHRFYQNIMLFLGQREELKKTYQEALEDKSEGSLYFLLGRLYTYDQAQKYFREGLTKFPNHPWLNWGIAQQSIMVGDFAQADKFLKKITNKRATGMLSFLSQSHSFIQQKKWSSVINTTLKHIDERDFFRTAFWIPFYTAYEEKEFRSPGEILQKPIVDAFVDLDSLKIQFYWCRKDWQQVERILQRKKEPIWEIWHWRNQLRTANLPIETKPETLQQSKISERLIWLNFVDSSVEEMILQQIQAKDTMGRWNKAVELFQSPQENSDTLLLLPQEKRCVCLAIALKAYKQQNWTLANSWIKKAQVNNSDPSFPQQIISQLHSQNSQDWKITFE